MKFTGFTHLCDDMQAAAHYDRSMVDIQAGASAHLRLHRDFEIRVFGTLKQHWSEWFNDCKIAIDKSGPHATYTKITCLRLDQAGLRGLLNKIWDLNLSLISVHQIHDPTVEEN